MMADGSRDEFFEQDPHSLWDGEADAICEYFGWLARWILDPEVLKRAHRESACWPELTPTDLPTTPGSFLALFYSPERYRLLRRGFGLPLRWLPERGHDEALPEELRRLGDAVLSVLKPGEGWGLHPAVSRPVPQAWPSLSAPSCWVSVAGGLVAARAGLQPRPRVLASGAWGEFGPGNVDGLKAKLSIALAMKATHLFVPVGQMEEVKALEGAGGLTIGPLLTTTRPKDEAGAREALSVFLSELTQEPRVPPEHDAEPKLFDASAEYYRVRRWEPTRRLAYYSSHLLPTIAHRIGRDVQQRYSGINVTHLVTIVSGSPELPVLVTRALNVGKCLLLYQPTDRQGRPNKSIEAHLKWCQEQLGERAEAKRFGAGADMANDIELAVREFVGDTPAHAVVFDMKPGTKRMTAIVSRVAKPGNWLFDMEMRYEDNRPFPGTERAELWQVENQS